MAEDENKKTADIINDLMNRIEKLESEKNRIRHTNETIACLEDALAIAIELINNLMIEREWTRSRVLDLISVLREGRTSPVSYDIEKPSSNKRLNRL